MVETPSEVTEWSSEAVARLAASPVGGYAPGGEPASEPTAWGALALHRAGATTAARVAADWLAGRQGADGSVGVTQSQAEPGWPTALAMLAWSAVDAAAYADPIRRSAGWAFAQDPWKTERRPEFGHDTLLEGWSWAPDTHSWLEPTAFFVVALREAGYADHPRRREAVRLLVDRLLPTGGANYGNTTVFGQELRRHAHSSGVVAWALAGESIDDPRLARTLACLSEAIQEPTGLASLAWAARGLAAHGRGAEALSPLAAAWPRVEASGSPHKLALWVLAVKEASPVFQATVANR